MDAKNRSTEVNQFMEQLDHPLKAEVEAVRKLIMDADGQITEHIKWNAPSFCWQGEDRVTFRLFPATDTIQLIFHRGAKVKDSQNFVFPDDSGLLKWVTDDRATVTFRNMGDVEAHAPAFQELISRWMKSTTG